MAILHTNDTDVDPHQPYPVKKIYAWIVFLLVFALMLSDYLSRQVVTAVFPYIKLNWQLTDSQLGSLGSIVALIVGIFCVPFSILADRYGRVASVTLMALVWSVATLACGFVNSFTSLLIARAFIGLGEAGYGGASAAILVRVFPARLHATVSGAFLAAAIFGSMLGVGIGGLIAKHYGWQAAFIPMGVFGVILAIVFFSVVTEPSANISDGDAQQKKFELGPTFSFIFSQPMILLTYFGAGLGAFLQGACWSWMPSYINRYYGYPPEKAALSASLLILVSGIGMIIGGVFADRFSQGDIRKRLQILVMYTSVAAFILLFAFSLPYNEVHYALVMIGLTVGSGITGPSMAIIAKACPSQMHATAFALLTMSFALIGIAPGPYVVGLLADKTGSLAIALYSVPIACLASSLVYFFASKKLTV